MVTKQKSTIQNDACDVLCVDKKAVDAALRAMPSKNVVFALSETFKTLADPTRLRIIAALSERELCVCDLAEILGVTGSAVSHQLRLLRGQRLVKYRKDGKIAYYTLDDEHVRTLISQAVMHISEE